MGLKWMSLRQVLKESRSRILRCRLIVNVNRSKGSASPTGRLPPLLIMSRIQAVFAPAFPPSPQRDRSPPSGPCHDARRWDMVELWLSVTIVFLVSFICILAIRRWSVHRTILRRQRDTATISTSPYPRNPEPSQGGARPPVYSLTAPGSLSSTLTAPGSWLVPTSSLTIRLDTTLGNDSADTHGQCDSIALERARVAAIRGLPRYRWAGGGGDAQHGHECVLCIESYADGDALCQLPCNHFYHERCIDRWLLVAQQNHHRRSCPLCMADPVSKVVSHVLNPSTHVAVTAGESIATMPHEADLTTPPVTPPPPPAAAVSSAGDHVAPWRTPSRTTRGLSGWSATGVADGAVARGTSWPWTPSSSARSPVRVMPATLPT